MHRLQKNAYTRGVGIGIGIALLDAGLKYWAQQSLPSDTSRSASFPVDALLHKNPGIIFDIPLPLSVVIPLTCLIVVVLGITAMQQTRQAAWGSALGLMWVTIGALGNLVDRVVSGFTTDYLIFFGRSAINLSDVLIVVGVIVLIWYTGSVTTRGNES